LISYKDNKLFVIEAKQIGSSESILKAILETYVYSKLVIKVKKEFYADFKIEPLTKIVPSVLTFKSSTSGQQLTNLIKYPYITQFIEQLNEDLVSTGNEKIRFFLMMNTENEIKDCLETKQFNGEIKIVFKRKFNLKIEEIKL